MKALLLDRSNSIKKQIFRDRLEPEIQDKEYRATSDLWNYQLKPAKLIAAARLSLMRKGMDNLNPSQEFTVMQEFIFRDIRIRASKENPDLKLSAEDKERLGVIISDVPYISLEKHNRLKYYLNEIS
jgi:hypothetical protein